MYHASGKPVLHSGSIIRVPSKPRVTAPYGSGISSTPYALESSNGWSPRLLKDVESRYGAKRAAREARRAPSKGKVRIIGPSAAQVAQDQRAAERAIAGTIGNVE